MEIKIPVRFLALVIAGIVIVSAGCITTKIPPVSKTTPPAILIDYHKCGGIAGIDNRLVIFDNGVAIFSGKSTGSEISLDETELESLKVLINQSQFLELEASYSAPRNYADLFTYTVTYEGKTVTAEDTAVPPRLETVIESLDTLMNRAGSNAPEKSMNLVNITP